MKYKVIYIVLYEDGSYITDNAFKDLEFEEAMELAEKFYEKMNKGELYQI